MTRWRKALFASVTILTLLAIMEAAARLLWWQLEERSFHKVLAGAGQVLQNDAINFMKQPDGELGYVLRPGFDRAGMHVSEQGFFQKEIIPEDKAAWRQRVAAMGESTTQGTSLTVNYPYYLRTLLAANGEGHSGVEMINGGVAGWVSDQVALWTEKKVAPLRPDIVVLYVGWNDFQSYDPFQRPAIKSYFFEAYGGAAYLIESSPLKLVSLASAGLERARLQRAAAAEEPKRAELIARKTRDYASPPAENYKFYLRSLDRIVAAFRSANPKAKITLCTVVGRWPHGTESDYASEQGATWWMKKHGLSPAQAASALGRFNQLIREYARHQGLPLVDAEASFARLDRRRLQVDFAHFTAEGYELLANVIYEAMRSNGTTSGKPSARLRELLEKYAQTPELGGTGDNR
jgi:lysophospholipase L1-like esterase